MFTILVICTGNVARSPTAEVLLSRGLRQRLKDGADDFRVHSAGTLGLVGEPILPPVRELLAAQRTGFGYAGCDVLPGGLHYGLPAEPDEDPAVLEAFRARRLEPDLLAGADLVLGATREHRGAAVAMAPGLVRRAFTLVELARLAAPSAHAALAEEDEFTLSPQARARAVVARASALRATVRPLHAADDDIEDPAGRDEAAYRRVHERIEAAVESVLDGLVGR